ncbi:DUF1259 domain-containing protein [Streptomyces sp. NBC_01803]|nr:DUF1259 domain-containing protein [Streptomyces sp. NBC_01803]WSA43683.1 DUF1259 domain-containing protein [Streptomyces sp. NBC_01803]
MYHVEFPRRDLRMVSYGITITPPLALSSNVPFVRYADGSTMVMGGLAVTERESQRVADALYAHGIGQTAIHKHLLAHEARDQLWRESEDMAGIQV